MRATDRRPARRFAAAAAIAAIGLLASACSSGAKAPAVSPSQSRAQASASASAHAAALAKDLKITPANGSHNVDPSAGITVTAVKGKVTNVTVTPAGSTRRGDAVSGSLSGGGTSWRSDGNLAVSQSYTVTATGTAPSGEKITTTSTFKTLTPAPTFSTHIFEGYKQSYGVGMPIILNFSQPDHEQGGGRAVARADHVQAGHRVLVLGRRRAAVLPAAGLLAGQHHGELHRPLQRGAGRQGRVRAATT